MSDRRRSPTPGRHAPVDRLRRVPQAKRFHSSDGLSLAYYEWGVPGASAPVALHHGFVANAHANWEGPGVVAALVAAGRHVIAPDARGHGQSDKPHDPASYGEARMAGDLGALLDARLQLLHGDHMQALADPRFTASIVDFLA